jgi:FG-GAP repeat
VWLMHGAQVMQSAGLGSAPTSWTIVETGDFNGDGKSDILWQDTSGNVAIWFMSGAQVTQSAGVGNVATVWSIQGANGDCRRRLDRSVGARRAGESVRGHGPKG